MKAFPILYIASAAGSSYATIRTLILLALVLPAYGEGPTFEVASIRPSPQTKQGLLMGIGCKGGPGTNDPGMWTCVNMNLPILVRNALDLRPYQFQGLSGQYNERFNVTAKVPEGATKEQFRQMRQNLLIERFGLKFHRERKEMPGYELLIAKNGPKFKESKPEPSKDPAGKEQAPPAPFKITYDTDGFPIIPPGVSQVVVATGHARGQWIRTTIEKLTVFLSSQTFKPVTDGTGLKGEYDISLKWSPDAIESVVGSPPTLSSLPAQSESSGPSLFDALQDQLGLKLQPKKVTIELLVVDDIKKIPTDN
jgi:uncharacterized protein (TIGR03435 family)